MSGLSSPNQTCTKTSTASATRLLLAMGRFLKLMSSGNLEQSNLYMVNRVLIRSREVVFSFVCPFVHPLICLFLCSSIQLFFPLSIHPYICPYFFFSVYGSVHSNICTVCPLVCPSISSFSQSSHPSICFVLSYFFVFKAENHRNISTKFRGTVLLNIKSIKFGLSKVFTTLELVFNLKNTLG